MPATFVFSTYGARGDVFPYLSIARELQKRGHRPIIAAAASFRGEVEALGLPFRPIRPDAPRGDDARRAMHPISGLDFLLRRLLLPNLRDSIADLRAVCKGAEVLVTHSVGLVGPIVAALEAPRGLKWASGVVSPLMLFERDAALPVWPSGADFPILNGALMALLKRQFGMNLKEVQRIRLEMNLPRGENALWSDAHSPTLQLCLWDERFAPIGSSSAGSSVRHAVGFCALEAENQREDLALRDFMDADESPLLFVAASHLFSPDWEKHCLEAARTLNRRAVLLGADSNSENASILRRRFASLDAILPRAAALVHAGGIGTIARGLDFALPMLLAPRVHDQFDNARRARKLGLARVISARNFRGELIAREIESLLSDAKLKTRLEMWRANSPNGAKNAADALEGLL